MRFRLCDVFLPSSEELQIALPREAEVEGTIVDFSDSGAKPKAFAVVAIDRKQTVVVPVAWLQTVADGGPTNDPERE